MQPNEIYDELNAIESIIRTKDVMATAYASFNAGGDAVSVHVVATEPYDANGYWHRSKTLSGEVGEIADLLTKARDWAYALPNPEDRAIELMIQKLTEMSDKLPKGGTDIASEAWREVHKMLRAKAESISKNGLPSPNSISEIPRSA